jgi:hypothetical protein
VSKLRQVELLVSQESSVPGVLLNRNMYSIGDIVGVDDHMQQGYAYEIVSAPGAGFEDGFEPHLSPAEMLKMGVFEGKYCNDCRTELPEEWFVGARVAEHPDPKLNYFEVKSRQPLSVWREKGWIIGDDPRGWFQWYCRYWLGRRAPGVDEYQIKRWRAFRRHAAQVRANCEPGNISCRPRQRQALLQWAHDPFI